MLFGGLGLFFCERPSSGIAGWRGGWIERNGSEGTRPAFLPAGLVPERWNVKLVFIETPDGPAINWTSLFAIFVFQLLASRSWGHSSMIYGQRPARRCNHTKCEL